MGIINYRRLLVAGLVSAVSVGHAQPSVVDTPWQQVSQNIWKKQIGGIGGQAELVVAAGGGKLTYSVTRPCVSTTDTYTISWRSGSLIARGTGCGGYPHQESIEPWLLWFQDVPLRHVADNKL